MLTLHVEAETHLDLIQKTFKVLGIGVGQTPAKPAVGDPPAPPQAAETAPAPSASSVASEPAALSSLAYDDESVTTKRRGRPRKIPPAEAVVAPPTAPVSAPQAEVGNTVSAPAVQSPAVEGASAAVAANSVSADNPATAVALTGAEVKETLRAMSQKFKDWNAGASKAMEIVKVYGLDRLKDLDKLDQVSLRAVVAAANEVKGDV